MKAIITLLAAVALVTGCRHAGPDKGEPEAQLRQQIAGTWWSGDRWLNEPFAFVTFFPDGRFKRFTRSSTNEPIAIMPSGYWRVSHTNAITFSVRPGDMAADTLQIFRVDEITDRSMVFTNPVERFSIRFTR